MRPFARRQSVRRICLDLLDTNVLSEPLRPRPDPVVIDWLDAHFSNCAISSIVVFELRAGLVALPKGKRRAALEAAIERAIRRFAGRVYPFDTAAAEAAAGLYAKARAAGRGTHQLPAKLADLQTAGIALANGLSLATRNTGDFAGFGIDVMDPWAATG